MSTESPSAVVFSPTALLRILKHCRGTDLSSNVVSGCLLGLDSDSEVHVSNVFLHPAKGVADLQPQQQSDQATATTTADVGDASGAQYQQEAMKLLKVVNIDNNIVGWFQSSTAGSFVNEATIEIQADYQSQIPNSVMVVYDPQYFSLVNRPFRAFRLSVEYLSFQRQVKERLATLLNSASTAIPPTFEMFKGDSMFVEVPIRAELSILDEAYLFESATIIDKARKPLRDAAFQENLSQLTTGMQQLSETVDDLVSEELKAYGHMERGQPTQRRVGGRAEEESRKLQAATDAVLLAESTKHLCAEATHNALNLVAIERLHKSAITATKE